MGSIRVSCGALCHVVHPRDGRLLLALNRNSAARGARVLKPLGGALTYTPAALPPALTVTREDAARTELRLLLPAEQLTLFADWFHTRQGRELSPLRELREELVTEYGVLPALNAADVHITYARTVHTQRFSDRVGATGTLTHSFQEIYRVTWRNAAQFQRLLNAPPTSGLLWVSEAQIRAGTFDSQTAIQAHNLLSDA